MNKMDVYRQLLRDSITRAMTWLDQASRVAPYELFSDVPDEQRARAVAARDDIRTHPFVDELIED